MDMTKTLQADNLPWYRHYWVWLLCIPPAAAVFGGITTAWLAGGPPSLVVDDYGEIAMATKQRRVRDWRAIELGLGGELRVTAGAVDGRAGLRFSLEAAPAYQAPAELRLQLIHPTQAERDQEVRLLGEGGRYSGELPALPGRMYLQLSDPEGDWRLLGEIAPGKQQVRLAPAPMPQARP